jgi:hypothetical protein
LKQRVERVLKKLVDILSKWNIDTLVLGEAADAEIIDPYFNIDIDIYFEKKIPDSDERRELLGSPAGFETSPLDTKDRFLLEDLPVKLSYWSLSRVDKLIKRVEENNWFFRFESTNILYRIESGRMLHTKDGWFDKLRGRLKSIPDEFWNKLKEQSRFSLDYSLNNMGAAVYRGDHYFFTVSLARFIQGLCCFLFALNRLFEPSASYLHRYIKVLEKRPDGFNGRFDSLIRLDIELTPEQKYEIAKLIAKSISSL